MALRRPPAAFHSTAWYNLTLLCILEKSLSRRRMMVVSDGLMASRDQSVRGKTLFMYFCRPLDLMHS